VRTVVVVNGPINAGKTTIGRALARAVDEIVALILARLGGLLRES